jgi:hypothetical protein
MADSTQATGRRTICMEKVLIPGPTADATKEAFSWTRNTDTGSTDGLTDGFTRVTGRMGNNMVKVGTLTPRAKRGRGFGKKARGSSGSMRYQKSPSCEVKAY